MDNYRPILPKPNSETHRINVLFSQIQHQLLQEGFASQEVKGKDLRWLIVYSQTDIVDTESGPSQAARILIDKDGNFQFQVFLVTLGRGTVQDASFRDYLMQMKLESDYTVCPGILKQYNEIKNDIRRKPINLRLWAGNKRSDSLDCQLWFNPKLLERRYGKYACMPCQLLLKSLRQSKKRAKNRSALPKKTPPKNTPLAHMTPRTKGKVLRKKRTQLFKMKKKLQTHEKYMCTLNEDQSSQMNDIMSKIGDNFSAELDTLFKENSQGDILRKIWEHDKNNSKQIFNKDQKKNKPGKSGNRFSVITLRIALAIFSRSKAAYEALKSLEMISLPSVSSLKQYMRAKGPMYERMEEEKTKYAELCKLKLAANMPVPLHEGALIFDEVKVTANIYWNSKSNKFIGHALTHDDMSSLHDIYQELSEDDKTKKASYILQFLWRDVVANVDIIGPYYTSQEGLDHKFIMSCVMETMHLFYLYDFQIVLLICDGASANLKLLKLLCSGDCGVFHIKENEGGWDAIFNLYNREKSCAERGEVRRVPDLLYSYVFRDKWTRLNVKASKTMQQDHVISEIKEFIQTNPNDKCSLELTVQYLQACNKMFENGILSHTAIKSADSVVLHNIDEGFHFFMGWCDDAVLQHINIFSNKVTQFLAWQTWDLTRLMVYGFKWFIRDFFQRHPNTHHYIIPVRLNGNAVETLFSQLKYSAGGQLSATNYATARSSILMKKVVKGHTVKDQDYRNVPLGLFSQTPLRKK